MKNTVEEFNGKIKLLKEARFGTLNLHKSLIDIERETFEQKNGRLTSGQFLQVLLNDENFSWLRKFSMLIVEIDEMFDLDDGYTDEMIEKHFLQFIEMFEFKTADRDFNFKFRESVQNNSGIKTKYGEVTNLLSKIKERRL